MAWHRRLANVFRGRVARDIERELAFHVAELADDLRSRGLSEEEAQRLAREKFGNLTLQRERTRDMDVSPWLEAALRNLRLAARALAKTPVFTATVVLTLALGIGANSAVFSAIDVILLRPLPFPEGDQLVRLLQRNAKDTATFVAPVRLNDWNRRNSTLQGVTGHYPEDTSELSGELPERLKLAWVAARFLEVLGVSPALGRGFRPEEERFGGPGAVLISDRFWRRRFNADPEVIGKRLRLNQFGYSIVGVMPASFAYPDRDVDIWSPSPSDAPYAQLREATWFTVIGRLKPGVTLAQARSDISSVQAGLGAEFPKTDAELRVEVQPLKDTTVRGAGRSLWLLFGSVSLLLLIACTNIAALLLARATQRRHEISVRFSLGASRFAVAMQLLSETFLLALSGAALGLLVAGGASRALRALAASFPRIDEITLDGHLVAYTLACAVAGTLLCGVFPAIRATRRDMRDSLNQAGRTQVSARRPLQWTLVGVQVALAVTLLAGAGLLLRSFQALGRVAPGFDASRVLTFHVSTNWGETTNMRALQQWTNGVLDALRSIPGVEAAATSIAALPGLQSDYQQEVTLVEGRAESEGKMMTASRYVSAGYFDTMRIPLLAGELCREEAGPPKAVVNRSFADKYLGGSGAIGRHLQFPNAFLPPAEITGVVGDARETGLNREPVPVVYACGGAAQPLAYFLVRTRVEPMAMASAIRQKMREIEPRRAVFDLTPLEDHIREDFSESRLRAILLAFFALTAVSLASVGLYGTLSYLVNIRRREVGLRLALGAVRGQIVRQFLAQGLGVTLVACAAGLALSLAFTRLLAGMLYGVSATDPPTLSAVVLTVLGVAALASLVPAIRAARVEPMQVLRDE